MREALVLVEQARPSVTMLTLNRPDRRNALGTPLMEQLEAALERLQSDAGQRVVILRGAGPVFCAGLDLKEAGGAARVEPMVTLLGRIYEMLQGLPQATIAAVHGAAMGGGMGLMATCDFAVAADDTRLSYPEVRRGLLAGVVMPFMRRQLRERDARELLLLGETFDAAAALRMGMVNRVVAAGRLMDEVMALADTVLEGGPETIARTKRLLDELYPRPIEDDIQRSLVHHRDAEGSPERAEGIAAFLEKRPPAWSPRAREGNAS
jgi:methylglutaconyl-CoA hydratase